MLSLFKTSLKLALHSAGYDLRRRPLGAASGTTLSDALARLRLRGENLFNTVIDVGASDGRWSREAMAYFPTARYCLIEAQPVHASGLEAFCTKHANADYVLAAAGREEGHIYFDASDPFGGVASDVPVESPTGIRVPMTTIDHQVKARCLPPPYLLKLDVHGYELPILNGAIRTIEHTSVCIIECYNFPMQTPSSLRFPDMLQHLERLGFRCADMYDFLYRPKDQMFWQMDILFIRSDRDEFKYNNYI